ncbi:MAG TPA: TldD/PmbA family protein [Acidimicrobiales bacterium]|nr:TldD/PmbA family protein [Acidimicrobiales bacterium]
MADLSDVAAQIVGWAKDDEEVEAYVARTRDTAVRVYAGDVESLSSAESAGVGVRVVLGDRQGFAYTGSLDEADLVDVLAEARDNAAFATPDEHVGLAVPDGVDAASLDLWRPALADLPADRKVAMALELEQRVRAGDPRIRQVESANYGDASVEAAIASTTGITAATRRTACHLSAYAIAGDGSDTQTGGGYSIGREPDELDLEEAAADAVDRATRLLGATKARSTHLTVVFDPRVTTVLLGVISSALSGEAVLKGRSLFADRLGEEVGAQMLTLIDDPTDALAYGAATHDAEGLACRRNVLVENGVVARFLYDTYAGRRAGTPSTGSAVRGGFKTAPGVGCRALSLVPGTASQEEILASVEHGLLVQWVTGVHSGVNPISGDFSVGAEGLMIRNGALAEPVREVTIASTIQRMLAQVVAVGSDLEWLPGIAAGLTLAIGDVSLSGA